MDVEKDILANMDFRPRVAKDLREMDVRLFREEAMGVKKEAPWTR